MLHFHYYYDSPSLMVPLFCGLFGQFQVFLRGAADKPKPLQPLSSPYRLTPSRLWILLVAPATYTFTAVPKLDTTALERSRSRGGRCACAGRPRRN
jgi:hypothetical protein